ncbi:mucin-5AC [Temnothorax curvispinosus]|uniref:Mucin-5AC n=1 Tax=Temnothorax curvispinosus TaxID=300111 RepID=A0A6J1R4F8_9HYME|nr:mucin-5AC [Temnothorax curvispinosus]
MAVFDPPRSSLPLLLVLMMVTLLAALTSSPVNAAAAGASSAPSVPAAPAGRDTREPPPPTVEPPDATGDKKALRYSSVAEGGPILMSTSSQRGSVEVTTESLGEVRTRERPYAGRTGSVVARKGVEEKIKPRKGVPDDTPSTKSIDQNVENVSLNQTTFESMKPIMESSPAIETAHIKSDTSNVSNPKLNTTDPRPDSLNHGISSNASLVPANKTTSQPEISTTSTTAPKVSSHIEKHVPKPKPTVTTVDGPEINESIPLSRTKNPPLGMPRKIDYIVPVIITIFALPILGAVIFVLYRRGRDCWDKRHYRRMDFLIDGMYND